jgi:hypothetical protein
MREEATKIYKERQLDELLYEQDTASGQDLVQRFQTLRKYFSLKANAGELEKGSDERIVNIRDRMQLVVDFEKEIKELIEELNFMMDFAKRRGADYGVDLTGARKDAEAAERFGIDAPTAAQAGEEGAAAAGEGQSEAQALLDASGLSGEQIFAMVGGKSPVTGRDLEFGVGEGRVQAGNEYAKLFSLQYFFGKIAAPDPSFQDKVLEYINQKPEEAIGILLEAPMFKFLSAGVIYDGYISNVIIPSFLNRRQFEELMQARRMRRGKGGVGSIEYVDVMRESPAFKDVADENSNKLIDILSSPAAGRENIKLGSIKGDTDQAIAHFYNGVLKNEEISQESKTKFTNKLMSSNSPVKNIIANMASDGGGAAIDFEILNNLNAGYEIKGAGMSGSEFAKILQNYLDRSVALTLGRIERGGEEEIIPDTQANKFLTALAAASEDLQLKFLEAIPSVSIDPERQDIYEKYWNLALEENPSPSDGKKAQNDILADLIKSKVIPELPAAGQQVSERRDFKMTVERLDELIKEELINHRRYKKAIGIK